MSRNLKKDLEIVMNVFHSMVRFQPVFVITFIFYESSLDMLNVTKTAGGNRLLR